MQADITDKFVLMARLDQRLRGLARMRAGALFGLVVGILLLLFAGGARPAQPLLPWLTGGVLSALALPLLLVSQFLLRLRQDTHRGLVRHLFRRGHRIDYPEFTHAGGVPTTLQMDARVRLPH